MTVFPKSGHILEFHAVASDVFCHIYFSLMICLHKHYSETRITNAVKEFNCNDICFQRQSKTEALSELASTFLRIHWNTSWQRG